VHAVIGGRSGEGADVPHMEPLQSLMALTFHTYRPLWVFIGGRV